MQDHFCFAGAVVSPLEFQRALEMRWQAKLAKLQAVAAPPLTDDEVRARIDALRRANALLRQQIEQERNKLALNMAQEIIKSRQRQPEPNTRYRATRTGMNTY